MANATGQTCRHTASRVVAMRVQEGNLTFGFASCAFNLGLDIVIARGDSTFAMVQESWEARVVPEVSDCKVFWYRTTVE